MACTFLACDFGWLSLSNGSRPIFLDVSSCELQPQPPRSCKGLRRKRMVRLSRYQADPHGPHWLCAQHFGRRPQCSRRSRKQRNQEARHGRRSHQRCFARRRHTSRFRRRLAPWPVAETNQPFHEPPENRRHIPAVHRTAQHHCVCRINLLEDGFQIVLLRAFTALRSWGLYAGAAVPAELNVLFGQVDGVRGCTLFPSPRPEWPPPPYRLCLPCGSCPQSPQLSCSS